MEDKHLSVLNSLTQLEDLTLAGASITDDGLGQLKLPRLRRLFLDACTKVTDAGLYHLAGMPELEELLLMGSGVRGEDLMGLAESGLKKLRRVFLNADQVRGGQPVIDALHGKLPDCEVIILRG
ncbi:MAG: hypothetical protein KatS3mg110_0579 [Pirellulaceae bacterium]|nr:MAG: hypothetical protein KatS3mg110_0579 [Pirellulaceae bacterium]